MSEGVALGDFEVLVVILISVFSVIGGWLLLHERWFRDKMFPMYRNYYGNDADDTDEGHKSEMEERVEEVHELAESAANTAEETQREISQLRGDVSELTDDVREHNEQERRLLRRLVFTLDKRDVVDITEVADEDHFLRGGGDENYHNSTGDD